MALEISGNNIVGVQNHGIRVFSKQNGEIFGDILNNTVLRGNARPEFQGPVDTLTRGKTPKILQEK